MNIEKEMKNSTNKFELEGNIGNINKIYINPNGKKTLRFDLGQNKDGNTQFIPIIIKGNLVDTYGKEIKKGNWVSIRGIIVSYLKEKEKEGKTYKDKIIDILGFEITDRTNNKVYTSDGKVVELNKSKEQEK